MFNNPQNKKEVMKWKGRKGIGIIAKVGMGRREEDRQGRMKGIDRRGLTKGTTQRKGGRLNDRGINIRIKHRWEPRGIMYNTRKGKII